jgi:hypothetical protein
MHISGPLVISLAALVSAFPNAAVKRQVSQLRPSYDFVIVGGGTSGLTVADRLTKAFPKSESGRLPPCSRAAPPDKGFQKRSLSWSMARSSTGPVSPTRHQTARQEGGLFRPCQTPK